MAFSNLFVSSVAAGAVACAVAAGSWAKPAPVAPDAKEFQVGKLQAFVLRDADNVVQNDGKTFGVGHSPAEVAAVLRRAGAPEREIRLSVDALLVKAPGQIMLFDTGLGPSVHGVLVQSLAKAGVQPADVTDIFITHSHGDHVGGLRGADGAPAFPRAVVHMSVQEWSWMQDQAQSASIVRAISSQVRTFDSGVEILPGVRAVPLFGHTPGHVGYLISSGTAHLLDMGDLAHSSVISLAKPDWPIAYDTDPEQGIETRKAALAQLVKGNELVFGPHMPFPGVGRVATADSGYVWRPSLE